MSLSVSITNTVEVNPTGWIHLIVQMLFFFSGFIEFYREHLWMELNILKDLCLFSEKAAVNTSKLILQ